MPSNGISKESVLLKFKEPILPADTEFFVKDLKNFGFSVLISDDTGIEGVPVLTSSASSTLDTQQPLSAKLQSIAQGVHPTADSVWSAYDSTPNTSQVCMLDLSSSDMNTHGAVALLLQMSLPVSPIVEFNRGPQALPRHHAHFVRSLVFWRNRNGIAQTKPRLVHAGDDGSLVYILGSWLVALNWNSEEISIDVGDTGTMWLMLGTPLDVQLQGSLLILPAFSGAILANELAR